MVKVYYWSQEPSDFEYFAAQIRKIFSHKKIAGIGVGSDGARKLNELEHYLNSVNYYRAGNVELRGGSTIGPRRVITKPSKISLEDGTHAALFFDIGCESGETCIECVRWGAKYLPVEKIYFGTICDYSGYPQLVAKRYTPYKGLKDVLYKRLSEKEMEKIGDIYTEIVELEKYRICYSNRFPAERLSYHTQSLIVALT